MAKPSRGGSGAGGVAAPSGFLRLPAELSNKADWTDADIYQRRQLLPEGTSRTEALTAIQTGMRNFTQNKSAKWWIDNRDRVNSVAVHINAQR